jgi:hypothetical protein
MAQRESQRAYREPIVVTNSWAVRVMRNLKSLGHFSVSTVFVGLITQLILVRFAHNIPYPR